MQNAELGFPLRGSSCVAGDEVVLGIQNYLHLIRRLRRHLPLQSKGKADAECRIFLILIFLLSAYINNVYICTIRIF